jgi:long-chain acyl-CoA synthetase
MNPLEPSPQGRDWLNVYPPGVPATLSYPDVPVSALAETSARRFPDRAACTLFGQAVTYSQLVTQAEALAVSLVDLGARPGRFVGLLLPNLPEHILALQATWLTGATALQLSLFMVPEEIERWMAATACHIVIALDLLAPKVIPVATPGSLEHLVIVSLAPRLSPGRRWLYRLKQWWGCASLRSTKIGMHQFDQLIRPFSRSVRVPIMAEEDVAVLAPTGGTTALPKAVMLTHRNLVANAMQLCAWSGGEDGSESMLGILPFFHAFGLSGCLLSSLAKGATLHLLPRFEAVAVLELLRRYRIQLVPAVPAVLGALNRLCLKSPPDLSFIRAVFCGASALDPTQRQQFERLGPRYVVEGYGLTEASPVTHGNPLSEQNRPGTLGLPLPDTEARIVDAETGDRELPAGTVGELVVRGPQVMKGYFNSPTETALVLRGGWLYTGDLARRDGDGFFTLVDRKKDIIKTSGFLVFPAEVEEILTQFEGVAEAVVIGQPDAERGELVKALVVPRPGASLDVRALEKHCGQHLSQPKRPRIIEIVPAFAKNFLGKVPRHQLRAKNSAGQDS